MAIIIAEKKLKELMGVDMGVIYLIEDDKIIRFDVDKKPMVFSNDFGLIGECIKRNSAIEVIEPYKNSVFNLIVDIDTNLPLVTYPVKDSSNNIIAVYQLINLKSLSKKNYKKIGSFENQIYYFFAKILEVCIERCKKMGKLIDEAVKGEKEYGKFKNKYKVRFSSDVNINDIAMNKDRSSSKFNSKNLEVNS